MFVAFTDVADASNVTYVLGSISFVFEPSELETLFLPRFPLFFFDRTAIDCKLAALSMSIVTLKYGCFVFSMGFVSSDCWCTELIRGIILSCAGVGAIANALWSSSSSSDVGRRYLPELFDLLLVVLAVWVAFLLFIAGTDGFVLSGRRVAKLSMKLLSMAAKFAWRSLEMLVWADLILFLLKFSEAKFFFGSAGIAEFVELFRRYNSGDNLKKLLCGDKFLLLLKLSICSKLPTARITWIVPNEELLVADIVAIVASPSIETTGS